MLFDKIKNLKGALYRKALEPKEKEEEIVPGFSIEKPKRIVEFPNVTDISKVNITYPLIEPFAYANIKWDEVNKDLVYILIEPQLTTEDDALIAKISDALIEIIDIGLSSVKEPTKAITYLETQITKVIHEFGLSLTQNQYTKIMYHIYRNFIGFNEIEPLLQDPNIEDISCDGINTPIYVIHRKYGSIRTSISYTESEKLREFIIKLAERCGRYVSYAEPILASTLPDGSRVSANIAGDIATHGPTFTIRKFGEKPFSPTDQIDMKTVNSDILAYYWYLVEHGASMLIVGGVATGKTSLLNTVSMFIPPEAKIVSIEDTREIRIPHEHWIPGLARVGFGIPLPTGEKYGEVTLFDLLKESFRQNPDYVIVGEVRGEETYVMFQGMSSGHPSLSTFHAGSVDTVIKRLTTQPIDLSPTLLESLDVITILTHAREKGKSARRTKEIVEIIGVDPKTNDVQTNVVFRWNPVTDEYEKVNDSVKVEKFATARGTTLENAMNEIAQRKKVIEWMHDKGVKDYLESAKIINRYYKEPDKLFVEMGQRFNKIDDTIPLSPSLPPQKITEPSSAEIPVEPIPVETKDKNKVRRSSILDLLGFKMIREK